MTTLRIVGGGEPSDEELAALVTVVSLVQSRSGHDRDGDDDATRWRRAARPAPAHHRDDWRSHARRSALRHGL